MNKYFKHHFFPILCLIGFVLLFFWKVFVKDLIPFPGDLLVGAYYPWLEYKWGYIAGVPVKNGLISDVFSEMYIWKHLVIDSLKAGQWPLWNPYAYSGYPLLANFSSGALYIFNLLLLLGYRGWSSMVILQVLGSGLAMYWFLTLKENNRIASLGGAIAFAFSASMMGRLEWNSAGHVMMWFVITLALLEHFFKKNQKIIILLPLSIFFMITAGHFQTMFYSVILVFIYTLFRLAQLKNKAYAIKIVLFTLVGILLSSIQILPTFTMMSNSIRLSESAVSRDNFGLLPLGNLISLTAPDYFGNPTTGNFWGFLNYSETIFYPSILGLIAFLWAGFNFKNLNSFSKFFFFVAVLSIFIAFDNPIGRLVYQLKIPIISTGYAARIAIIWVFSTSILIATFLEQFSKLKIRQIVSPFLIILLSIIIGYIVAYYGKTVFLSDSQLMSSWLGNVSVASRNLILPGFITLSFLFLFIFRKLKLSIWLVIILLAADLFRFGWKYNPFVTPDYLYPTTPITDFLTNEPGLFRIATQNRPILPAQTWAMFGLSSASGYDPLISQDYAYNFSQLLNHSANISRYSLLDNYNSKDLGIFNIKYLLIDKDYPPLGKTTIKTWDKVFETEKVAIFKNQDYRDRVEWSGEGNGSINLISYTPNKVSFSYVSDSDGDIIVRDTWNQGWKAFLDGQEVKIDKYINIFRTISVPKGSGTVMMVYQPQEWLLGKKIFLVGSIIYLTLSLYIIKFKYNESN